jgi:hypothetical protein
MRLREVKRSVRALSVQQLAKLDDWLHGLIKTAKRDGGHKARAVHTPGQKTYRREFVRCGKKGCKCAEGQLHGPYWYAYWTEGGRTKSQYIGKKPPKGARRSAPQGVR